MQETDQFNHEEIFYKFKSVLLDGYFQAVKDVNKKGNKLSRDDKLKILLAPVAALSKLCFFSDPIPFISDHIELDHDLDLKNLTYDRKKYFIDCPNGILDPATPCIYLTEKNEFYSQPERIKKNRKKLKPRLAAELPFPAGISLMELHKKWLPSLTQKTIQSKDLLDQALVAYTIKKGLNGDEIVIEKFYGLYEGKALKQADKLADKLLSEGVLVDKEDIRQDARILLRLIIGGFKSENILKELFADKKGNRVIGTLPLWVKNFYIEYLSKYIPEVAQRILRRAKFTTEKENLILDLMLNTLFNPYSAIVDGSKWRRSSKAVKQFNSYSFRPGSVKMGPTWNLTTWLFSYRYGKLYQLLRDKYRPSIKQQSREIAFDYTDNFDESRQSGLTFEDSMQAVSDKRPLQEETVKDQEIKEKVKKSLLKSGISERDAEIYIQWILDKLTQVKIAKIHNLSIRQIRNICHKVNEAKNLILPDLRQLVLPQ